jgi:hypothetical protein
MNHPFPKAAESVPATKRSATIHSAAGHFSARRGCAKRRGREGLEADLRSELPDLPTFIGFYGDKTIQPVFPRVLGHRVLEPMSKDLADRLGQSDDERDRSIGAFVRHRLDATYGPPNASIRRRTERYLVLELSDKAADGTVRIKHPLQFSGRGPWTQGDRWTVMEAIRLEPDSVEHLERLTHNLLQEVRRSYR